MEPTPTQSSLAAAGRVAWSGPFAVTAPVCIEPARHAGEAPGGGSAGLAAKWVLTMNELRFGTGIVGASLGDASARPQTARPAVISVAHLAHALLHRAGVGFFPTTKRTPGDKTSRG